MLLKNITLDVILILRNMTSLTQTCLFKYKSFYLRFFLIYPDYITPKKRTHLFTAKKCKPYVFYFENITPILFLLEYRTILFY